MRTWIAGAGLCCVVLLGHTQEHETPLPVPPAVPVASASAEVQAPQQEVTEAAQQTVTVTATSDARAPRVRFTAYEESYQTAKKVWEVSKGSVVMALRLIPAKLNATIDDVRVALKGNGAPIPVKVSPGGVFVVPLNADVAAQDGIFLVNKERGELTASMVIQPAVERDAWNIARIAQVLHDAKRAVRAITPWYKRPFAKEVQSLAFCATEQGSSLQLMEGEQLIATLPMSEPAVNDINAPVFCKIFDGEDKYPDHYRMVLPEHTTVLLL
ncbi:MULTISPECIES: hypothetical protein [unclassified Janthinobacterium]|uniref:hypothetical protein n=1 Tax=unclassified Janthinobacterium TaxID=2610881 RepID=UPI0016164C5C|nr:MULTISPECIES: hypothetical protein [unclassified Janthinobacterium]MBB5366742.1 hypothetical protein [Janthinobacterium sp. K2C7]MBB5380780.1 hypothetical protein [Janthinobacterium sp. K2Li3]MBB5385124.1 hypothetical protein [Janthinobacterium sp. K2E3]